ILSCITLAQDAQDRAITTIEGLAGPAGLDPVQRAFADCGALQCGFCQPGMMISARALLNACPQPSLEQIKEALSGNLCRCTGYTKIYEAVDAAAQRIGKGYLTHLLSEARRPHRPGVVADVDKEVSNS